MREIKFRVWEEYKYTQIFNGPLEDSYLFIALNGSLVTFNNYGEEISLSDDRFVIQQFTGLKDRNGKEVYEGDIVAEKLTPEMVANGDTPIIGSILFVAGAFIIDGGGLLYENVYSASPDILEDFLVVGNIFENPDLLNSNG